MDSISDTVCLTLHLYLSFSFSLYRPISSCISLCLCFSVYSLLIISLRLSHFLTLSFSFFPLFVPPLLISIFPNLSLTLSQSIYLLRLSLTKICKFLVWCFDSKKTAWAKIKKNTLPSILHMKCEKTWQKRWGKRIMWHFHTSSLFVSVCVLGCVCVHVCACVCMRM